ncbi:T9SS type A sorting domain-containing protein [Filimonas effusa]|uniref:T9SS type A sorting domain-containing protein n=1 Tax=Filimonas effusa TaxID=2508721 RepID=A0A4Q1D026_9BACT|nr:T9SS type A sorting domain-containing protein [Filimonas effusa]RXK81013.1 T9SS type A sorting domain-containing protein [Filimonas effusa]
MKHLILYIISLLLLLSTKAQRANVYIPPNSTVGFFNTDTTAIFGDINNEGKIYLPTNSYIYFLGQNWKNNLGSAIIDESITGTLAVGGTVQFQQPDPLSALPQRIFGGYTAAARSGTYFPNIDINNPAGIFVDNESDLAVRNQIHFRNGKITIRQASLVSGSTIRRGHITGYNQNNYVVTENGPYGGFMYRLSVPPGTDTITFPIGTEKSYTPAAIINHGETDDYRARVFNDVYTGGLSGTDVAYLSTGKTWIIANDKPVFNSTVLLQHLVTEEGPLFAANRTTAYVSHLKDGAWDTTSFSTTPASPGNITTGTPFNGSAILSRVFNMSQPSSYLFASFTKATRPGNATTNLVFSARRLTNILASLSLDVDNERNVYYYEIQKRRDTAANWIVSDTITATNALAPHNYRRLDHDVYYRGLIHYRVRIVSYSGTFTYSPERTIEGIQEAYYVQVFPNPGFGNFNLRVLNMPDAKTMVVYDQWGDALLAKPIVSELTPFDLTTLPSATYYVVIYGDQKRKLHTEKIIKLKR